MAEQPGQRRIGHARASICPSTAATWARSAYTNMRQNQQFQPFTLTPFTTTGGVPTGWAGIPGVPVNSLAALAGAEPERQYQHAAVQQRDHHPGHARPEVEGELSLLQLRQRLAGDQIRRLGAARRVSPPRISSGRLRRCSSISISYTKQNAGSELNWRPSSEWNSRCDLRLRALRLDTHRRQRHAGEFGQGLCGLEAGLLGHRARQRAGRTAALRQLRLSGTCRLGAVAERRRCNPVFDSLSAVHVRQPRSVQGPGLAGGRRISQRHADADDLDQGRRLSAQSHSPRSG